MSLESLERFAVELDAITSDVEPSQREFLKSFAFAVLSIELSKRFAERYVNLRKEIEYEHRNIGNL